MAVSPFSLWSAPVPIKHAFEQDAITPFPKPEAPEDEESQGDRDRRFMSSLPAKVYGKRRYLEYQATWCPEDLLPGVLAVQRRFRPRSSDVLLASYPKSGTTWTKALVFATMSRKVYPPLAGDHPLRRLNPHDCVVHLPAAYATGKGTVVEALPSPRIMATHMPFSTLPAAVVDSGCKIVYVWRDPKDVLVSLWHFYSKLFPEEAHMSRFHDLYESFCQGDTVFGPWWENVLAYFRASVEMPTSVLFLRYEDMLEDTACAVVAIADFLGCPFSAEEERARVVDAIVKLCSFDELKNLDTNKSGRSGLLIEHPSSAYFRKGVAGDWMDHMTQEMADRIDTIVQGKFQGSGLKIKPA